MPEQEADIDALQSRTFDNPQAPEIFASLLHGAGFDSPNVRMTFVSNRHNHAEKDSKIVPIVNLRLVMSVASARQMIEFLTKFLAGAELNATQKPPDQPMQ